MFERDIMDHSGHFSKAEKNIELLDELYEGKEYRDWIITLEFYSALHLFDAFLALHEGHHPRNHRDRRKKLRNSQKISPEYAKEYLKLQKKSEYARYGGTGNPYSDDDLNKYYDWINEKLIKLLR